MEFTNGARHFGATGHSTAVSDFFGLHLVILLLICQ